MQTKKKEVKRSGSWSDARRTPAAAGLAVLACATAITGCAETARMYRGADVSDANDFCAPSARSGGDPVLHCENFAAVEEGKLPPGWLGGDGLIVKQGADLGGRKVLTTFQKRDGYSISIPWSGGSRYRLDQFLKGPATLDLGNVRASFIESPSGGPYLTIAAQQAGSEPQAESKADIRSSPDFWTKFHMLSVIRDGAVFKVAFDGQQLLTARYEGLPDPEQIVLSQPDEGATLAGIRLSGVEPQMRAAAAPAMTSQGAQAAGAVPASGDGAFVAINYDFGGQPIAFAFLVDGRKIPGDFKVMPPPGGDSNTATTATFSVPPGRLLWAAFAEPSERYSCEGGGEPIKDIDLAAGQTQKLHCWQSGRAGTCCESVAQAGTASVH